jgi:hypothetical protein
MKPDEIAHMGAPDAIRCVPVPCWVEHDAYLSQMPEANDACVANGVCRLLQDIQVDLTGSEFAWHFWTAQRVLTRAGAERIAQFGAEFDPAFQRCAVKNASSTPSRAHSSCCGVKPLWNGLR